MKCPKCHAVCGENDRFCQRCGAPLSSETPKPMVPEPDAFWKKTPLVLLMASICYLAFDVLRIITEIPYYRRLRFAHLDITIPAILKAVLFVGAFYLCRRFMLRLKPAGVCGTVAGLCVAVQFVNVIQLCVRIGSPFHGTLLTTILDELWYVDGGVTLSLLLLIVIILGVLFVRDKPVMRYGRVLAALSCMPVLIVRLVEHYRYHFPEESATILCILSDLFLTLCVLCIAYWVAGWDPSFTEQIYIPTVQPIQNKEETKEMKPENQKEEEYTPMFSPQPSAESPATEPTAQPVSDERPQSVPDDVQKAQQDTGAHERETQQETPVVTEPQKKQERIECPYCHHANESGYLFCGKCGMPLTKPARIECPNCQFSNESDNAFCGKCGMPLTPRRAELRKLAETDASSDAHVVLCPSCRHRNDRNSKYCEVCGVPLPGTETTPSAADADTYYHPELHFSEMRYRKEKEEEAKNYRIRRMVGLASSGKCKAAIILLGIAFGLALFSKMFGNLLGSLLGFSLMSIIEDTVGDDIFTVFQIVQFIGFWPEVFFTFIGLLIAYNGAKNGATYNIATGLKIIRVVQCLVYGSKILAYASGLIMAFGLLDSFFLKDIAGILILVMLVLLLIEILYLRGIVKMLSSAITEVTIGDAVSVPSGFSAFVALAGIGKCLVGITDWGEFLTGIAICIFASLAANYADMHNN